MHACLLVAFRPLSFCNLDLVGACFTKDDRIFATGSDGVSKNASLWLFLLDLSAYNHGLKGPQKPKHMATIAFCTPIFHPLSLLLGWDPCDDRILRSCLHEGPATIATCFPRKDRFPNSPVFFFFSIFLDFRPEKTIFSESIFWIFRPEKTFFSNFSVFSFFSGFFGPNFFFEFWMFLAKIYVLFALPRKSLQAVKRR